MRLTHVLLVTGMVAGTAALGVSGGATAASDVTAPVWTKVPAASIALGTTLDFVPNCSPSLSYYSLRINIDYQATDRESGIDHYRIRDPDWGNGNAGLTTRYSPTNTTSDPADCGGGRSQWRTFDAINGAGLGSTLYDYHLHDMGVRQDSGTGAGPAFDGAIPGTLSYSGTWTTSSCACWSDGTTRKTTKSGAAATFTFQPEPSHTASKTWALALVMAKGPDRGKAAVYVDGVKVATVDTYSATAVNRTVVWRQTVSSSRHTLRVVNLATKGHPRIDLDAVVVVPKESAGPYPAVPDE